MKKYLIVALALASIIALAGCGNRDMIDTVYSYDKAIVRTQGGLVIEGKPESWRDYEDSDMIQVTINGVVYYTHGSNVTFIKEYKD